MTTGAQVVAKAATHLGMRYAQGPTRLTGVDGYTDCSGEVYMTLSELAARPVGWPATSWADARYCRDFDNGRGTLVTVGQAAHEAGCLLFMGPNHAYDGYGDKGHEVITVGDGVHTIEAEGHAYGVVIGKIAGRNWSNAARIPGIDYGLILPPPAPRPPGPVNTFEESAMKSTLVSCVPGVFGIIGNWDPGFQRPPQIVGAVLNGPTQTGATVETWTRGTQLFVGVHGVSGAVDVNVTVA